MGKVELSRRGLGAVSRFFPAPKAAIEGPRRADALRRDAKHLVGRLRPVILRRADCARKPKPRARSGVGADAALSEVLMALASCGITDCGRDAHC